MAKFEKKGKKTAIKKKTPVKQESKFISQALVNRRKNKSKKKRPKTRGVVYIKNLPHGFFEEQLRGYFSQYGAITRLRLGRSPKTLKSRGYAFIEFRYPEVAQIAAEAMNNYIMFHRIVKTKYIPPNEIRHDFFKCNIMKINKDGKKILTSKSIIAKEQLVEKTNRLMTDADQTKRMNTIKKSLQKKNKKLSALGLDYDLNEIAENMGVDITEDVNKSKLTINDLKEQDLDDEADVTFDPVKLGLNSEDEYEDYEYGVSESESEDEVAASKKKEKAIKVAKDASKKKPEVVVKETPVEKPSKKVKAKENPVEKKKKVKTETKKDPEPVDKPAKRVKAKESLEPVVTPPKKKTVDKKKTQSKPKKEVIKTSAETDEPAKIKKLKKSSNGIEKKKNVKKSGKKLKAAAESLTKNTAETSPAVKLVKGNKLKGKKAKKV